MKERAGEFSGPEGRRAVYNHAEPKDKRCCGCVGTERETVRRMDTQREGKWERLFFFGTKHREPAAAAVASTQQQVEKKNQGP